MRRRESDTTSDVGRRRSPADFTELRRRDVAGARFKGLVIPSTTVGGSDGAKSSVCLPTIAAAKPQSKRLLTSSTPQRRGSIGYQSVLTGLPFSTSASRSGAAVTASSGAQHPFPRRSSDSSFSTSLLEVSRMPQPSNSVSVDREKDVIADKPDLRHADVFHKQKSTLPETNRDGTEASVDAQSLPPGISPNGQDERPTDDRRLSRQAANDDNSSFSPRLSVSSSASERTIGKSSTTTESLKINSSKTGKQCEERHDDVVLVLKVADVSQKASTCLTNEVDTDRCVVPTSEALGGHSVVPPAAQRSTSVDNSRVRLPASGAETATTNTGQD